MRCSPRDKTLLQQSSLWPIRPIGISQRLPGVVAAIPGVGTAEVPLVSGVMEAAVGNKCNQGVCESFFTFCENVGKRKELRMQRWALAETYYRHCTGTFKKEERLELQHTGATLEVKC